MELILFPGHQAEQVGTGSPGVRNTAKLRKNCTEELKRDAVRLMRGHRSVAQVAGDLGVNANQLHAVANAKGETLLGRELPAAQNERLGEPRHSPRTTSERLPFHPGGEG